MPFLSGCCRLLPYWAVWSSQHCQNKGNFQCFSSLCHRSGTLAQVFSFFQVCWCWFLFLPWSFSAKTRVCFSMPTISVKYQHPSVPQHLLHLSLCPTPQGCLRAAMQWWMYIDDSQVMLLAVLEPFISSQTSPCAESSLIFLGEQWHWKRFPHSLPFHRFLFYIGKMTDEERQELFLCLSSWQTGRRWLCYGPGK